MSRSIGLEVAGLALLLAFAGCSSESANLAQNGTGGDPGAAGHSTSGGAGQLGTGGRQGSSGSAPVAGSSGGNEPSTDVTQRETIPTELVEALSAAEAMDGEALRAAHPLKLESKLAYEPLSASGLDLIQKSALALTQTELDKLAANGLVISTNKQYPTFAYGYKTIYSQDLPLYVSADSILFAVHRSFDKMLIELESIYLKPELGRLLDGMRSRLATSGWEKPLASDLDLYLTLAKSLLEDKLQTPVAGADPAELKAMFDLAKAAEGHRVVTWFGSSRDEDFSQFEPRGHYADEGSLAQYFRAMMLLGRVDLRIIETTGSGSQVFHREQFDAAVAFDQLLGPDRERWANIDGVIGAFVGERDSMSPAEMNGLLSKLGANNLVSSHALSDSAIVDELARGGWGAQRIASRIIIKLASGPTLPLDRSYALFGQRYTVDSHVFVNTTFDRVTDRLMPDPLDVAFAALANDAALAPLGSQLDNASYAGGLAKTRTLVDAHEASYWDSSLYTSWLSALRTLSPASADLDQQPSLVATRAFQDRILNTQLASWAELRHDTILYAKQSYTTGNTCEFPDAYVDPYPELYARLGAFAERVRQLASLLPTDKAVEPTRRAFNDWVTNFQTAMGYLQRMAENQRSGTPHEQELLDFINAAVSWKEENVCGEIYFSELSGWYLRLFFIPQNSVEADPTIADVHTQPTDEVGTDVGRILHVGTGNARLMVTTVETCNGPRAYVGLASSYGETIEENWSRLNDKEWRDRIATQPFPDPAWLSSVLAKSE